MDFLSELFIGVAHAQDSVDPTRQTAEGITSLIPLVIIFFIFYFLLIRPQQKKLKEHEGMVTALKRNDKVVTAGGIVGTISKVNADNETIEVKISSDVEVTVMKNTVASIVTKSNSSADDDQKEEKSNKKKKNKK